MQNTSNAAGKSKVNMRCNKQPDIWEAGGAGGENTRTGSDDPDKALQRGTPFEPHDRYLSQMVSFHFLDEEMATQRTEIAHSSVFCFVSGKVETTK